MAALEQKGTECYLPCRKEIRQWKDRKKQVETPLIRGYLFVRIDIRRYYDVLVVPGVISFVAFDKKPAIIPDYQIDDIRIFLANAETEVEVSSEPISKGQMVRINNGPFCDVIGEVCELRGKKRIVVRIKALGCSVHAELGVNLVAALTDDELKSMALPAMA